MPTPFLKWTFYLFICFYFIFIVESGSDKVKLSDISVLTLYNGRYTNGRRSSPIPQLRCVGGTAGCHAFVPDVVQCTNKGSDGYDVQWECKTEMENKYKFGRLQVSCEGYDYPDDPYVLKGSCGLEYNIDLVNGGGGYYSDYSGKYSEKSGRFGFVIVIIGVIAIFLLYKCCIASSNNDSTNTRDYRPMPDAPPPYSDHVPPPYSDQAAPPPPGFRPEYSSHSDYTKFSERRDPSCNSTAPPSYANQQYGTSYQQPSSRFGGFWSGATIGGLAGYLFGSRNQTPYHYGSGYRGWGGYGGSTFGSGFGSSYSSRSGWSGGSNSGSRTTSGFGGTSRR